MSNNLNANDIEGFIVQYGPENCYIGITANITIRFRQHHGLIPVDSVNPRDPRIAWIHMDAATEQNTRDIEQFFLNRYRNQIHGGTGGGINPNHVAQLYIHTGITNENV